MMTTNHIKSYPSNFLCSGVELRPVLRPVLLKCSILVVFYSGQVLANE